MRLSFVLGGIKGLRYPFTISGEWEHHLIPQIGNMIEGETVFRFANWDMIPKEDFINQSSPSEELIGYYNESINNGETHSQAMRWLLIEHLGGLYYVDDVMWRTADGTTYPEIWLSCDSRIDKAERKLDEILRIYNQFQEKKVKTENEKITLSQGLVMILISISSGTILYWIFVWMASILRSWLK